MGVPFPQKYGGMGGGEIGYCILMEELGRVCSSTATIIGAHIGIGAMAIYLDGTEEQKQKYLVPLAQGTAIGAFGLTEAQAGSDAAAIKTTAVRDGDDYVLNGAKVFITNGDICRHHHRHGRHRSRPWAPTAASPPLSSRPTRPALASAAWKTRWASAAARRPSASSRMCACPRRTCWASSAPDS